MSKKMVMGLLMGALCCSLLQAANSKRARKMIDTAMNQYAEGNFKGMRKSAAKALKLDPGCSNAFVYLGIHHVKQEEWPVARAWLERALVADPGNALALSFLGEVHYRNGDMSTAADHWRRAVHFDECLSEAQAGLALSLYQKGQVYDAVRHYKEAVRCDRRYYDVEYLSDAVKGAGWPKAKVEAVLPLLEQVPPPTFR